MDALALQGASMKPERLLSVGQQPADFLHVAGFDDLHLSQAPFSLGSFFGQNMAVMGFGKRILTASGFTKTLGG